MYIETKNLVKTFSGRNVVDGGVSLRVDKGGQVVGLLGPNGGAGKTTSFYMIVGGIERPSLVSLP